MKVKILSIMPYFLEVGWGIEIGKIYDVQLKSLKMGKDKNHIGYLIYGDKGKPLTMYDYEVSVIN